MVNALAVATKFRSGFQFVPFDFAQGGREIPHLPRACRGANESGLNFIGSPRGTASLRKRKAIL